MRWVLVVVALLSFASRSVIADGPWGSNCPPGYHGVLNDNPESPDYGSVDCVPDAPVNPGAFAIWWPVDPASLALVVARVGATALLALLVFVLSWMLIHRYFRRLENAVIPPYVNPPGSYVAAVSEEQQQATWDAVSKMTPDEYFAADDEYDRRKHGPPSESDRIDYLVNDSERIQREADRAF